MTERAVSQLLAAVLGLTLLGSAAAGSVWGLPTFLLGCAAGALSIVIILMWSSLQQIGEDEKMGFEQALAYAAPSAEEEQKRAVLRTLKDLEYERSVGKISEDDFEQMSADVRAEAKRLIAITDESMKERIAAAEQRLVKYAENTAKDDNDAKEDDSAKESK